MIKFQRQHETQKENASVSPRDILRVVKIVQCVTKSYATSLEAGMGMISKFLIKFIVSMSNYNIITALLL